jgi:signal transduction histidine kinase
VPCTLPPIPSDVEATLRSFEERDSDLETKIADRTAALTQALRASLNANEVKNTFIATLSHELRTPLSGIIGISELLLENSAHSTPNNDLKKILGASRHLLDLVNQVLDLSKIEAGHIHLQREPLELRPLVLEITDLVQPLCDRRRNTLQVTCPEAIGRLDADATKLRQILLNLLSNACQFTEAGHISLTATRCEEIGLCGIVAQGRGRCVVSLYVFVWGGSADSYAFCGFFTDELWRGDVSENGVGVSLFEGLFGRFPV